MNTHKTSLEDNTALADDNDDENAVEPLVVPNQIPENQAEQTPHEDSSAPVPETGDSVVEVDTSLSYDDWLVKEGIKMSAGEEEHDIKIKVEDVTDSEGEGVEAEGKSDDDQEESSEFQDNKEESRASLDHISKIKDKPGSSDGKKSDEKDVNLEVELVDITSQVESLIKKGDTEEKSAAKIKRLNNILKLLCDQRKRDEEEKQKAPAQSMIRKKLVKDGSSAKTEERGGGQSVQVVKLSYKSYIFGIVL